MWGRTWRAAGTALFVVAVAGAESNEPSDAEVRKILIAKFRAAYTANCACPYDTDSRGRRCGKRSAYSREGGEAPLCYDHDVSKEMIAEYRARSAEK